MPLKGKVIPGIDLGAVSSDLEEEADDDETDYDDVDASFYDICHHFF
jgi:hypothetical protein